ncbi:hypothetical protein M405DRAFT_833000 [Rhizopogon salebrosus TDB-379]|nr:hypothetical protein M405DRAFT_833000 [Rhizopogon salebrosus TDB-379]
MQLQLDCLWWFTFLSRMAFLISAPRAISKLATGLINETLTDVFLVHCTSYKRPASFTVFCENFMNLPPTNGLLRNFRNVDGEHIEGGNVVLIKHPLGDVHHIENMTHADVACAGKLLEWCAKRGDLALRTKQYWI